MGRDFLQNREAAVELQDVTTAYPRSKDPALRSVTLRIPRGALALITGPNGAGKTTLLQVILGFLRPLRGRVFVLGHEIPGEALRVRRAVGYLKQDFMKPPTESFRVKQVVAMGLAPYKRPFENLTREEEERIREALRSVGMEGYEDRPLGTLSGGQQQRVMLARAIVRRPRLLLLDEPFSSVDKEGREEIARLIDRIRRSLGATVVVVSHDLSPIVGYASMLVELQDGMVRRVEEK